MSVDERQAWPDALKASGIVLAVTGWPGDFDLALESLDLRRSGIELLGVRPGDDQHAEVASVFVPDDKIELLFTRLREYAELETARGAPRHQQLVANIASLSAAALPQLWTEREAFPDEAGVRWWEVWLRRTGSELAVLGQVAEAGDWTLAAHTVSFETRLVTAVQTTANSIAQALGSRLPIAELRRPRLVQTLLEMPGRDLITWVGDLAQRLDPAPENAPRVSLLDTGIYRHTLLQSSIDEASIYYVVGTDGADRQGHGTELAGLALFGSIEEVITAPNRIRLRHRLESVKILPDPGAPINRPDTYAAVTISGTASPEADTPNIFRVRCIANSDTAYPSDGRPTSWSAAVDAMAFGTDVTATASRLELLTPPDPGSGRLFLIAAGNVRDDFEDPYLDRCDTSPIEDPAQAWNAITVGAYTELGDVPDDPSYRGYRALGTLGDLSPFSRTSMLFSDLWPLKPDLLMEGGNVLVSRSGSAEWPDTVCVPTTANTEPAGVPLKGTNATSSAVAQASHLAAVAKATYPDLWPEAIRALLVHSAEWTDPMRDAILAAPTKAAKLRLARRYGFGVPTLGRVLTSARGDVTLLSQSEIVPFELSDRNDIRLREMHLHDLPWPRDQLLDLQDVQIRLRVTLSYFVEPNPSSRGWRGRYAYPSHGLRFDLRRPGESTEQFRSRLNALAEAEEGIGGGVATGPDWVLGSQARNRGSLHADMWTGTAADLADAGVLGVYPVGGWWKNNNRRDRADTPVRYSLVVSLLSPTVDVDLYTPIAAQIGIPIEIAA